MRILVTGASGGLGAYLLEHLVSQGFKLIAWSGKTHGQRAGVPLQPVDLSQPVGLQKELDEANPDVIVHLAAISTAAEVFRDPIRAQAVNVEATQQLVDWCDSHQRRLLLTSTDLVFSGEKSWYSEEDPAEPAMIYARTKQAAENIVLRMRNSLVARMPLMFGPSKCGKPSFFDLAIADLRAAKQRTFFEDEFRTPLDYQTASILLTKLLVSNETGIVHVAGAERMSRFEMMRRIAKAMGLDDSLVRANKRCDAPGAEPRPADVSLSTKKLTAIFPSLERPQLEDALTSWSRNP
jgi:dTDP-4-dehydrorhamnose reductase